MKIETLFLVACAIERQFRLFSYSCINWLIDFIPSAQQLNIFDGVNI